MSHVAHDLFQEFAADSELLHTLKLTDAHFQRIADQYHDLNREIHRIETDVTPASDEHLERLKKERLALLDTVAQIITRAKAAA